MKSLSGGTADSMKLFRWDNVHNFKTKGSVKKKRVFGDFEIF